MKIEDSVFNFHFFMPGCLPFPLSWYLSIVNIKTIDMNEETILTIKNKSEVLYLRPEDILYIQADGNYCNKFNANGT